MDDESLLDGLVGSPLGAMLLHVLEGDLSPHGFGARPLDPAPSVDAVAEWVTQMTTDDLVAAMLAVSSSFCPWIGAAEEVTEALSAAPARRAIAEGIATTHGRFLTSALARDCQVAWFGSEPPDPLIRDLTWVYECGEFPWGGLRTHTALAPRHDDRLWDAHDGGNEPQVMEWRLPVRPEARIAEIHSPNAWLDLVRQHPSRINPFRFIDDGPRRMLASGHNAWDIRPRSIEADGTATVRLIDGSERTGVRGLLMPDWTSVATEFDGVHVSWAGFLLAEGNVVDAGDGWLAVLRFWGSEQTVFLADLFDSPEEAGPVNLRQPDPRDAAFVAQIREARRISEKGRTSAD